MRSGEVNAMSEKEQIIRLGGRLTAATAPSVRRQLRKLVDADAARLVIDLSEVTFVDSSGLSVLVTTFKAARGGGGDVVLLQPQPNVRSLLELTRLHRVFQIFEDRDTAVRALEAQGGDAFQPSPFSQAG